MFFCTEIQSSGCALMSYGHALLYSYPTVPGFEFCCDSTQQQQPSLQFTTLLLLISSNIRRHFSWKNLKNDIFGALFVLRVWSTNPRIETFTLSDSETALDSPVLVTQKFLIFWVVLTDILACKRLSCDEFVLFESLRSESLSILRRSSLKRVSKPRSVAPQKNTHCFCV